MTENTEVPAPPAADKPIMRLVPYTHGACSTLLLVGLLLAVVGVIWAIVASLLAAEGPYTEADAVRAGGALALQTFLGWSVTFFVGAGLIYGLGKREPLK